MAKFEFRPVSAVTAVAQSSAVDIGDFERCSFLVQGTFVATVQPQVSADGVNWVDFGSPVSAPTFIPFATSGLAHDAKQFRLDVTAFTSGSVEGGAAGRDSDRSG